MKRVIIKGMRVIGVGLLLGATTSGCSDADSSETYFDYCDPSVPADECYALRRDPESDRVALASEIALRYMQSHPVEAEIWDWRSGVLMFSLTELYRVTGDPRFRDYYQAWLDYWISEGYQLIWSDSCPPAITAVALLADDSSDDTDEQLADYRRVIDDTLAYLDDDAQRTKEGGISHYGIFGGFPSVWLDSLFMFGMVLNRWGELPDNEDRLDMMEEQVLIFADLLQDDNGFMRHATDWPGYDESVYWARGNSWVVASLSDYLRIRIERGEEAAGVDSVFRNHVAAIASAQDATGLWWTVMDRPELADNYTETSASALFAYGMARAYRYGVLGDEEREAAQRSVQTILDERIEDEGDGPVVTGTSTSTDPYTLEQYLNVPVEDDVNYGVGAVVLALIETSGLPD